MESKEESGNWAQDEAAMDLERTYPHKTGCELPYAHVIPDECRPAGPAETGSFPSAEKIIKDLTGPEGNIIQDLADMPAPGAQVARYADEAMFRAVPLAEEGRVEPRVTLVSMTPDPIRTMAAANAMYKGRPVRAPRDITVDECLEFIDGVLASKIAAPLEFCDLHILFEGVSRAFTHQLVRQRTAVYVQESMRFAVKENAALEVLEPPSLTGLPDDHPWVVVWRDAVTRIAGSYNMLVDAGMPAEDARGLLPTNITTRVHYKTNLRMLVEHAGLRLCSQAQYEWKQVWALIIKAILGYGPETESWQQRAVVDLFRPVCYATGKCEFMGPADRYCVIRERVEAHHRAGELSSQWADINPRECLQPGAARKSR